ncbi:MAG: hypothetical protein JWR35_2120, partial [Marmoricola sp.]|nr:hypothetical protein [Marmoricola sp.]
DTATAPAATTISPGANAVNLSTTPATIGVYPAPGGGAHLYGIVSGTTNDLTNSPAITLKTPYNAATPTVDNPATVNTGDTSRAFSGVADFSGYNWDTNTPAVDDALVTATDSSDDATMVHLYKQTIGTGTTAAAVQNPVRSGTTTSVTVTVLDQNGKPVAGAKVVSTAVLTQLYFGSTKTTNSRGQATFTGISGTTTGVDYTFYVDDNGSGSYQAGAEVQRIVNVKSYAAVASKVTIGAAGAAYDRDDLGANPFSATLVDQNGNPLTGSSNPLQYRWTTTSYPTNPPTTPTTTVEASHSLNPDSTGKISIPAPINDGVSKLEVWSNQDGNPGPDAADIQATPLTVSIGQAAVVWNDGNRISVTQGSTHTFTGSLQLPDGTKLGGKTFSADMANVNGDVVMAVQGGQPSGTTRTGNTTATVTTAADGTFGVALTDQTTATNDYGDVLEAGSGNYDSASLRTDFMDTVVNNVVSYGGTSSESLGSISGAIPGVPQLLSNIRVTNATGQSLVGVPVTISVDHGYLTPDTDNGLAGLTPATPAAEGGVIGAWKNLGSSVTATTGEHGNVSRQFAVAIGHDDAFADGDVTTTISIKAAGVSPTSAPEVTWNASDPINPGALTLGFDADQGTYGSRILPKASTVHDVYLAPTATDQFGNVTGQAVTVTNSGVGSVSSPEWERFGVDSDVAGTQTVSGKVTDDVLKWGADADTTVNAPGYQPSVAATGSQDLSAVAPAINWYTVDLASSTYKLTHNTANTVAPGTTVFETYTAKDQFGQPLAGYGVTFLRTGPDKLQDGNYSGNDSTDANGVASYVFQGTTTGTASVTGVLFDVVTDHPVPQSSASDTVTFAGAVVGTKVTIHPTITVHNGAKGNDIVRVYTHTKATKGAVVKIKIGTRIVATGHINAAGQAVFTISDANKKAVRKFHAVISSTAHSKAGTSNIVGLK